MRGARGALGKELVFRQRAGKTVISLPPKPPKGPSSELQQMTRTRFREAMLYARAELADPLKKAAYAARALPGQTAWNVAVADYLRRPVIEHVEAVNHGGSQGGITRAHISDDFKARASATAKNRDTRAYAFAHAHAGPVEVRIRGAGLPRNAVNMKYSRPEKSPDPGQITTMAVMHTCAKPFEAPFCVIA